MHITSDISGYICKEPVILESKGKNISLKHMRHVFHSWVPCSTNKNWTFGVSKYCLSNGLSWWHLQQVNFHNTFDLRDKLWVLYRFTGMFVLCDGILMDAKRDRNVLVSPKQSSASYISRMNCDAEHNLKCRCCEVKWTSWRLKSPPNQVHVQQLIQADNKEIPHHWPFM